MHGFIYCFRWLVSLAGFTVRSGLFLFFLFYSFVIYPFLFGDGDGDGDGDDGIPIPITITDACMRVCMYVCMYVCMRAGLYRRRLAMDRWTDGIESCEDRVRIV